ncbi:general substrate transporter [Aspergillus carlsbadensis]|nr:general substrate transporter [Aspergillus carlsbadensis]
MMTPQERTAWFSATAAAMVMALAGYDASTFNSIQGFRTFIDHFKEDGDEEIKPNILGGINTAYHVGAIASGLFISPTISKRFGRRVPIQLGTFIVLISVMLQTFAPEIICFIAGRVLMGLGKGISMNNGPTYIAEIAPARIRGVMLSLWQLWYAIGAFLVYWAAYGAQRTTIDMGMWQWRIPLFVQIPIPVFIIVSMFFCPESPRWLVENDRVDEARHSLSRVRSDKVDEELTDIVTAVAYEKATTVYWDKWWAPYWTLIREPSLLRRTFVVIFINVGQQISGSSSLNAYTTLIYKSVFKSSETIALINALSSTCSIVFTLSCTLLVDRAGRRFILMLGAAGMCLSLLVVAILGMKVPENDDGTRPYGMGVAVAAMFFLFIFFYKPSWGATVWVYTSEIFSTNVRAHGVAVGAQSQSVASTILNQFFPNFLANCGFYTFFFFVGVNALLVLGVFFFLPETKGIPLEEIDVLFGSVSHLKEGQEVVDQKLKNEIADDEEKIGPAVGSAEIEHATPVHDARQRS